MVEHEVSTALLDVADCLGMASSRQSCTLAGVVADSFACGRSLSTV